jgi:hypothetical protein
MILIADEKNYTVDELHAIWKDLVNILKEENPLEKLEGFKVPQALMHFTIPDDDYDSSDYEDEEHSAPQLHPLHYLANRLEWDSQAIIHVMDFFIKNGAPINILSGKGNTPLLIAAQDWSREQGTALIDFLLSRKANPTLANKSNRTALTYCFRTCYRNPDPAEPLIIALKLIDHGAELTPDIIKDFKDTELFTRIKSELMERRIKNLEERLAQMELLVRSLMQADAPAASKSTTPPLTLFK